MDLLLQEEKKEFKNWEDNNSNLTSLELNNQLYETNGLVRICR